MIKFQVTNPDYLTRKWNDKITGDLRSMRIQTLLAFLPDSQGKTDTYDKVEFILNDSQNPYPIGLYTFSPSSFYLDRNGRLQISLSNLVPVLNKQLAAA